MLYPGAVVIGSSNDRAERRRAFRALHRSRDFISILQRNRADCRSAAAKEGPKRAGFFRGGDHAREERNQFSPVRLMQIVRESATQIMIMARDERGRNRTCICTIFHCSGTLNS